MEKSVEEGSVKEEYARERARTAPVWGPEEIGYCTNVHPGESLQEVKNNLQTYAAKVRKMRKLPTMEVGLWLSYQAATELQEPGAVDVLKTLLQENDLEVRSLNGFPFGGFHQQQQQLVKTKVYEPDWNHPKRLDYSLKLVDILLQIMPEKANFAAISTLPLGYKTEQKWQPEHWSDSFDLFRQLTAHCHKVHQETGKRIVFAIEMEPDCALEFTPDIIAFFEQLRPCVEHHQYLTICLDTCHQAVNFESLNKVIRDLIAADIEIGKVQLSSALKFDWRNVREISQLQSGFARELCESPWLHQMRLQHQDQSREFVTDFKQLLQPDCFSKLRIERDNPIPHTYTISRDRSEARVHCHVPIFALELSLSNSLKTQTTQDDLLAAIAELCLYYFDKEQKPVMEVETYSWSLLMGSAVSNLCEGIVDELKWANSRFALHKPFKLKELRDNG